MVKKKRSKQHCLSHLCDIDELEKSEQKTENVTQINAQREMSKHTQNTMAVMMMVAEGSS